jgi:lysophospholipase L1-like esterase
MANPNRWEWNKVGAPLAPAASSSRWRILAELAIPLAVAAFFFARGKVIAAGVVGGVGLTLFAVSRISASAAAKIQHAFAKLGFWVGEILTWILLLPVFFGIFTPVALWLRLRGQDPLESTPDRQRSSYWVRADHERPKHRYFHQFSDERYAAPPSTGRSPLVIRLVTAALWLVLLNVALGAAIRTTGWADRAPLDARAKSPVYAGQEWASDYFRELAATEARYKPFLGWQRKDFPEAPRTARYIHIEHGLRRTENPPPTATGTKPLEIAFFGGSTVWGVGSTDHGTLPSAFARIATAAGYPVHVTNLGEDGYVQWQEVMRLDELVADGAAPDLAILYDGANDVFTHFQTPLDGQRERIHQNLAKWQARFLDRHDLLTALRDTSGVHLALKALASRGTAPAPRFAIQWPASVTVEQVAATVARRHREGAAHVARIGKAYGFPVASFWQPTVFTKRAKTEDEKQHAQAFGDKLEPIYAGARAALGNQIVDLGDTFADATEDVYIDWCHVGEDGNEVLARRILDSVAPLLRARLASSVER